MKDSDYRIVPIWFWPIFVLLCWLFVWCGTGCRGGRVLSDSSAGTIIQPQTPQEINEQNAPIFEPLPPPPIIQPPLTPKIELSPIKSRPTIPVQPSVKANPVVVDPKPVGELEPFKPSATLITGDGGCIPNLPPPILEEKIDSSDNKVIINNKEDMKVNWTDLLSFYLLCAVALIVAYMLYDIGKIAIGYWKNRKSAIKPKKRTSNKAAKKRSLTKNKKRISSKKKVIRKPRT